MSTKYLDLTGLTYLWGKLKAVFALDSAVVHNTSNETVAGTKTFSSDTIIANNDPYLYLKHTSLTKGTAPSSNEYCGVLFRDKNNVAIGSVTYRVNKTSGLAYTYLSAVNYTDGETGDAQLVVYKAMDGTAYATAPTPAAGVSDTKIPTTAWITGEGISRLSSVKDVTAD